MARDIRIHCWDHTSYSVGGGEREKEGSYERKRERGRWQLCVVITAQGDQGYTRGPGHTQTHTRTHQHNLKRGWREARVCSPEHFLFLKPVQQSGGRGGKAKMSLIQWLHRGQGWSRGHLCSRQMSREIPLRVWRLTISYQNNICLSQSLITAHNNLKQICLCSAEGVSCALLMAVMLFFVNMSHTLGFQADDKKQVSKPPLINIPEQ